jgi:hypothetical protein
MASSSAAERNYFYFHMDAFMKPDNTTETQLNFEAPNGAVLPKDISLDDCMFYTVQDIPGLANSTKGFWDLRKNTEAYLGYVDFKNKSVLELGPASGYLTFWMERVGAIVTSIELSISSDKLDVVPNCRMNWMEEEIVFRTNELRKVQNGYWYAHNAHKSKARVIYSHISHLPSDIGKFDISTMCSVLLHTQNPFLAIQKMLIHTSQKAIITDLLPKAGRSHFSLRRTARKILGKDAIPSPPIMQFIPSSDGPHKFAWWMISPEAIVNMVGLLGFEKCSVNYHTQYQNGLPVDMFTVVCERTIPIGDCHYI